MYCQVFQTFHNKYIMLSYSWKDKLNTKANIDGIWQGDVKEMKLKLKLGFEEQSNLIGRTWPSKIKWNVFLNNQEYLKVQSFINFSWYVYIYRIYFSCKPIPET